MPPMIDNGNLDTSAADLESLTSGPLSDLDMVGYIGGRPPRLEPEEDEEEEIQEPTELESRDSRSNSGATNRAEEKPADDPSGWTKEDLELARSYGYSDDAAVKAEFQNADDLRRYVRRIDQRSLSSGERFLREQEANSRRQPTGRQPVVRQPQLNQQPPQGNVKLLSHHMREEGYDETAVKQVENMERLLHQMSEERQEFHEHRRQMAEAQRTHHIAAFDSVLDSLGHTKLFGGQDGPEQPAQYENRKKLFSDLHQINIGRSRDGLPPLPLTADTLKRVIGFRFQDELKNQAKAELKSDMQRRSKMRTGGSSTRRLNAPGRDRNYDPVKDPELHEAFGNLLAGRSINGE